MKENIVWTCTYCHINPEAQSNRKCPRCGRKLTQWDLNKAPMERKPEWPYAEGQKKSKSDETCIDYTKFYNKNIDDQ